MNCVTCDAVVEPTDTFCGSCGTRTPTGNGSTAYASPAATAASSAGYRTERDDWPGGQQPASARGFFSHAMGGRARSLSNNTRYLCAAAYLLPGYATSVIRELLISNRAVAPSVGIDLEPVLRHCLRARGIQLIRDSLLALLLIISLFFNVGLTILLLLISFAVGFLPSVNWARKSTAGKIFASAGAAVVIGLVLLLAGSIVVVIVLYEVYRHLVASGVGTQSLGGVPQQPAGVSFPLFWCIALVAIIATQFTYSYVRSRALCDELGPDARPRQFRRRGQPAEDRIAQIQGAQHGNVVLYSGENPFIGTGVRSVAWSIAIELRREGGSRQLLGLAPAEHPQIDTVELHQVIRERLARLNDSELPPSQRLAGLTIQDHIVGIGVDRWDSPLFDQRQIVPYSQASPEAVAAVIRSPQAGVRYYQQVSVCDEGQAVWSGPVKVMESADQGIAASAFVYAAVEGHMFYLEFVSAVMPPIHPALRVVDMLPKISAGSFITKVAIDTFATLCRDLIGSPVRLIRSLGGLMRESSFQRKIKDEREESVYGDLGARISVRELGAAAKLGTYIQRLDAQKYSKIIERLVTDTVLDFLAAKGVDTSEYANSALTVVNSGLMMMGGNSGSVAFNQGSGSARATQGGQPQRARGQ